MNPQVPDELISAYFDGEVTPEERAAVERLLAESEDSQRELNETARLSALLHSFPREAAPVELVANVLRQTDQMAIPPRPPVAIVPTRHIGREWKAALISAVTTAVCLLILWNVFDHSPSGSSAVADNRLKAAPAGLKTTSPAPQGKIVEPVVAMSEVGATSDQPVSGQRALDQTVASQSVQMASKPAGRDGVAEVPEVAAKTGMPMKSAAVGAAMPAAPSLVGQVGSLKDSKRAGDAPNQPELKPSLANPSNPLGNGSNYGNFASLGLSNEDFVEQLRDNKLYTFVPQEVDTDSNVAVVYIDVADVERGGDILQVLLSKRSIQPHSPIEAKKEREKDGGQGGRRKRSEPGADDLVVLYIVARGNQLAGALQDAELHPDLFRGMSVLPPVQLAGGEDMRSLVRNRTEQKKAESTKPGTDKKNADPVNAVPSDEAESEMAEANQAVQALIERNSALNYNPTNSDLLRQYGANGSGGNAKGQQYQPLVRGGAGVVEKGKEDSQQRASKPVAMADRAEQRAAESYFVRLPTNPAPQNAYTSRAMSMNTPLERFGSQNSVAPAVPAPGATAAGASLAANGQRESGNRALRMLLVLQSASAETGQATPAGPEPAGKPGQ